MNPPISVIILTFNEEQNIDNCLRSIADFVEDIYIVDSYSTDKTLEIAKKYTDKIHQHKFENHASQLNWSLTNLPIKTKWVMKLDADERLTPELKQELTNKLSGYKDDITGLYIKYKLLFLGKWIKYGNYYPTWLLRIWRNGKGYFEERFKDEHLILKEGMPEFLNNDFIHENKKSLHSWTEKHNLYTMCESIELLNFKYGFLKHDLVKADFFGSQEKKKKWFKENIYSRSPLFFRAFIYFFYRYFFKLGFLDGKEGLIWHFLQGLWNMFLVDAKIYEVEKRAKLENKEIKQVVSELYNIKI